jgi:hypothetical protein
MNGARPRPVTAERLERALDRLAEIMIDLGDEGRACIPIYERLDRELLAIRRAEDTMAAARARLTRSRDRTAAIPS